MQQNKQDPLQTCRVFVGGISWKADETSLANFFTSFGKVVECKIIMDKVTGKSKGYGFVTFESVDSAAKVKQSQNLYFLGKMMNVGDAVRKAENQPKHGGYMQGPFQPAYQQVVGFDPNLYYNQNFIPQQQFMNPNAAYIPYQIYAAPGYQENMMYPVGEIAWQPMHPPTGPVAFQSTGGPGSPTSTAPNGATPQQTSTATATQQLQQTLGIQPQNPPQ